jgi:hypothetical protein
MIIIKGLIGTAIIYFTLFYGLTILNILFTN